MRVLPEGIEEIVETHAPRIETKNATIRKTHLGYEDHGILTISLDLDYGSAGQSFGGWALDSYKDHLKRRVGTQAGLAFIIAILKTLELTKWEDLPGTHIRVRAEHNKVHAIGHYLKDNWFEPTPEWFQKQSERRGHDGEGHED